MRQTEVMGLAQQFSPVWPERNFILRLRFWQSKNHSVDSQAPFQTGGANEKRIETK